MNSASQFDVFPGKIGVDGIISARAETKTKRDRATIELWLFGTAQKMFGEHIDIDPWKTWMLAKNCSSADKMMPNARTHNIFTNKKRKQNFTKK